MTTRPDDRRIDDPQIQDSSFKSYDDEIDLSAYLDITILWWKEILLLTVLATIAAALFVGVTQSAIQPMYEASSTVVIASIASDVNFEERFSTFSDDANTGDFFYRSQSRRPSLVGLVKNVAIAEATIEELGSLLDEYQQTPATLMSAIVAETVDDPDARVQSDLIRITAIADDPEKASAIANTWAKHYVSSVNEIYNRIPDSVVTAVAQEMESSSQRYADAQNDLAAFIAENQISQLDREILEKQTILENLQTNKLAIIQTQLELQQQEQQLRFNLFDKLQNAEVQSTMAVFDEQLTTNLEELTRLHNEHARTLQFLARSKLLHEQVQTSGEAAVTTNALAIELLKTQFYVDLGPMSLDLSSMTSQSTNAEPSSITSATDQEQDVASLISALETYVDRLDADIAAASDVLLNGKELTYLDQIAIESLTLPKLLADTESTSAQASASIGPLTTAIGNNYAAMFSGTNLANLEGNEGLLATTATFTDEIMKIDGDIHRLRGELETEQSRRQRLIQRRDLAWNAYDTVSKQLTELNLERVAANSVVRMGAEAPTPMSPMPTSSMKMMIILTAIVGMMSAILMAFLATYLGYKPFLSRRPAKDS